MFDISLKTQFSAGHHLRNYPGNCELPHGHNWDVTVTVRTKDLDELGMGIDFRQIKAALKSVIEELDHKNLNEHPVFKAQNPSSENLAVYIYHALKDSLTSGHYRIHAVTVSETPNSWVSYIED